MKTRESRGENWNLLVHNFPKSPDRKQQWIDRLLLNNKVIKKSCTVCSNHFSPSQYKGYKLVRKALPIDYQTKK